MSFAPLRCMLFQFLIKGYPMILPVILSGGAGTRLWPLSRELYPKQLLPLVGASTMLQDTVARLHGIESLAAPMIICNEEHRFMVAEQLRMIDIDPSAIILEPVGRNTAPAVAIAALQATPREDDPILLVLPADHVIKDRTVFRTAVANGAQLAEEGRLVTFGIVPDAPETGYGYIRSGAELSHSGLQVAEFVEKPDLETAQKYLADGRYFWNSGMFMFKASVYLRQLEKFNPEMLSACRDAFDSMSSDLDFLRLGKESFAACPKDSIDYAVMEKTDKAAVIPLAAGWSDVGSWSSLREVNEQDGNGNVIHGDVFSTGSNDCYLHADSKLVAAIGLQDIVVVETADAVLVAGKDSVQDVKSVVEWLKQEGRDESLLHRRVNRPWGTFESVDQGERFQVKRIVVNPGASLSLQRHQHRAEHWVVVSGVARVTCGDEVRMMNVDESTYIPVGAVHRLENPGDVPLEIIEVQSGGYLGEDDIERFEDNFGR